MKHPEKLFISLAICICFCLLGTQACFAAAKHSQRTWAKFLAVSHQHVLQTEKIIIEVEKEVPFKLFHLSADPQSNQPPRLYLSIYNTRISEKTRCIYPLTDSPVQKVRVGQNKPNITRVVLYLVKDLSPKQYRAYIQKDPFKIIVELFPQTDTPTKKAKSVAAGPPVRQETRTHPAAESTAAKQAPLNNQEQSDQLCTIVIDPGHGGKDPGASGHNGLLEKDVCLAIALKLKALLDTTLHCKTILTRDRDESVSLEQRTRIANQNHADLFISIHTNSHPDKTLTGVETYYLNLSSDTAARRVAARENFTTPEKVGDLEMILFDLLQNSKINESSLFAGYVHNALVQSLKKKYKKVRNLGVKRAPFTVLIDAEMPCILVETAFISNPAEARLLKSSTYQNLLARAITKGIRSFTSEVKTAYYKNEEP